MFFVGERDKFSLRAVEGRPAESRDRWTAMTWSTICGGYFEALGVPLVRGRLFNDEDTADRPPVVVINESMARRFWPGEDPIGKGLKGFDARGHNDEWVRVIGVVKDMHSRGLERSPMAQIYEAQAQSLDETENLVVRTAAGATVLRDVIRSVDKTAVLLDVSTLKDRLWEQTAPRRFQTLLVGLFAAIALILAGTGIFGMMHFAVAQRTREIGIRMAMGARPANVLSLVMREGFLLVGIGTAIGLAGSLALTRTIRSLLFDVGPGDPVTLIAVCLLLGLIALLACYLPASRATRVDPMMALRCGSRTPCLCSNANLKNLLQPRNDFRRISSCYALESTLKRHAPSALQNLRPMRRSRGTLHQPIWPAGDSMKQFGGFGGRRGSRTPDPRIANAVLSQLS